MNGTQIDLNSILKGSNPLVYALVNFPLFFMVPWSSGEAEVCKTSYTGSNPVGTSMVDHCKWLRSGTVRGFIPKWVRDPHQPQ